MYKSNVYRMKFQRAPEPGGMQYAQVHYENVAADDIVDAITRLQNHCEFPVRIWEVIEADYQVLVTIGGE